MSPQGAGEVISTEMVEVLVCDRWPLLVPEHRALRPEWPWWEWPRMASMRANLRTGDVLWDVGTEEGDQSAIYAQWVSGRGAPRWTEPDVTGDRDNGRQGGIVLIEPNPLAWPNVKAIWEANDIPAPLGWWMGFVGEESDGKQGEVGDGSDWPMCSHAPMVGDHGFVHLTEGHDFPTMTLSDLQAVLDLRCDAITIDIEGSELRALKGATRILKSQRPLVWVSIHPAELGEYHGETREDVIQFMLRHGYLFEHLAADHELHTLFYPTERARDVVLPYGGDLR